MAVIKRWLIRILSPKAGHIVKQFEFEGTLLEANKEAAKTAKTADISELENNNDGVKK